MSNIDLNQTQVLAVGPVTSFQFFFFILETQTDHTQAALVDTALYSDVLEVVERQKQKAFVHVDLF